jgi:hypothetical protein
MPPQNPVFQPTPFNMYVQNGDIRLGYLKINTVSTSAVVILGDAETISPKAVSTSRGVIGRFVAPVVAPPVVSPR